MTTTTLDHASADWDQLKIPPFFCPDEHRNLFSRHPRLSLISNPHAGNAILCLLLPSERVDQGQVAASQTPGVTLGEGLSQF